jgi:hypothetical protein
MLQQFSHKLEPYKVGFPVSGETEVEEGKKKKNKNKKRRGGWKD